MATYEEEEELERLSFCDQLTPLQEAPDEEEQSYDELAQHALTRQNDDFIGRMSLSL